MTIKPNRDAPIFINEASKPRDPKQVSFFLEVALLLFIFLVALLLRVNNLTRLPLWFDEANDVYIAYQNRFQDLIFFSNPNIIHPPLFFPVLRLWIKFIGIGEFPLRSFSVVMSMATLVIVYFLVRKFLSYPIALISVALLAVSSLQISWSQSIRPYAWFTLLVSISMFLLLFAAEKPHSIWRWCAYGLSGTVLIYQEYLSFHVIFAQFVILVVLLYRDKGALIRLGLTMLWIGVSFLPWVNNFLLQANVGPAFYLKNQGFGQLVEVVEAFSGWYIEIPYKFLLGSVFLPLFVLGIITLWKRQRNLFWVLLGWSMLPVLTSWTSSLLRPNFAVRYFVFCLPAFMIVVAVGIWRLKDWKRLIMGGAILAVITLNILAHISYSQNYNNQDWRELVSHVIEKQKPGDAVMYGNPYGYTSTAFNYYYQAIYDAPGNIPRYSIARVGTIPPKEAIAQVFKKHERVWIVNFYDGNTQWIVDNIGPNLPTNYTVMFYKEYNSTEQGTIALSLLVKTS